jgi:hypothetical protein
MDHIFSKENMSTFKINGIEYTMHNYILRKMSIFNVLFEENICKDGMLELKWSISNKIINLIFVCMYRNNFDELISFKKNFENTISYYITIISFLKYLGIDEEHIINVCMDIDLIDFVDQCSKLEYDPEMKYILEKSDYGFIKNCDIEKNIKKILKMKFPNDFKIKLIQKIIINDDNFSDFTIIFGVTYLYGSYPDIHYDIINEKNITMDEIEDFYKKFNFEITSYEIEHSNMQITKICINDKNIEIENLIEKCDIIGTIGWNISNVISMHIAKLLIGIETL